MESATPQPQASTQAESVTAQGQPSVSIRVANLSADATESVLYPFFSAISTVASIRVCRDGNSRQSLGYAYVNFLTVEDAQRAFDELNGKSINGKDCQITWAQRSNGNNGNNKNAAAAGTSLFVKNLPRNIDSNGLKAMFEPHGTLLSCELVLDPAGNSRGFGFVQYDNAQSADAAKKAIDGTLVNSHKITVEYYIANKRAGGPKEEENNWTNIFFKNTPADFTQEQLTALFSPFGVITSAVVMAPTSQPEGGVPTTFGFVNFETHEDAVRAVMTLNGQELDGRPIYVGRAQKKAEREENLRRLHARREGQRGGSASSGGRRPLHAAAAPASKFQDGLNLFIGNLDVTITEETLSRHFSRMGVIQSLRVITDSAGQPKGYAFVCYAQQQDAQKAIKEMNGKTITGLSQELIVRLHEPKKPEPQQSRNNSHRGRGGKSHGGHTHKHTPKATPAAVAEKKDSPAASAAPASSTSAPAPSNDGPAKPSTEALAALSPDDQKMAIGNYLYFLVSKTDPERAGKITGMILNGFDIATLTGLMDNQESLASKVKEATTLLESQQ